QSRRVPYPLPEVAFPHKRRKRMLFVNRRQAGSVLAGLRKHYADRPDVLVLALPRGGVPVAFEVARALNAPLDVFVVRKLGVPGQEELAMGAIATGDVRILNNDIVRCLGLSEEVIDRVAASEKKELERREHIYRGDNTPPLVQGHTVILVDDGLATGSTMRAALAALRRQQPSRSVVAGPVASPEACEELGSEGDGTIRASTPLPFPRTGRWPRD